MDSNDVKFCIHCGKKIPEGIKFCPYCGTKQPSNANHISENKDRTTRPIKEQNHMIKRKPIKKYKRHKDAKRVIWAILIVIILVIGGRLYTVHNNHVAVEQEVTRFRNKTNSPDWKMGVGTFLDIDDTRAQVLTSHDDFEVTKSGIRDITPPNDGFSSDYILSKNGDAKLIGINDTASQDNNLKDASNNLVTKSSTGHITYANVDVSQRDISTVADSIGTPNNRNFIIFKALPTPRQGIKSNQFMVLIKK